MLQTSLSGSFGPIARLFAVEAVEDWRHEFHSSIREAHTPAESDFLDGQAVPETQWPKGYVIPVKVEAFIWEHCDARHTKYDYLANDRIGEHETHREPHVHEVFDGEHYRRFNANSDYRERYETYLEECQSFEEWQEHEKAGGTAKDFAGFKLRRESWGYSEAERKVMQRSKRCGRVTSVSVKVLEKVSDGFIGPRRLIDVVRKIVPGKDLWGRGKRQFADAGIAYKSLVTRYRIQKTPPKIPQPIESQQVAYWGFEGTYRKRTDGTFVAVHPHMRLITEFSGLWSSANLQSKRDAVEFVRELPPHLLPLGITIYGSFKKLIQEFGSGGKAFECQRTGKKTRFNWSYLQDYGFQVISTFCVSESNNHDSRYRPVLDTWRYAVNLEKQTLRHQLRQRDMESGESLRVPTVELSRETATNPRNGKSLLDQLSPRQREAVQLYALSRSSTAVGQGMGISRQVAHQLLQSARKALSR